MVWFIQKFLIPKALINIYIIIMKLTQVNKHAISQMVALLVSMWSKFLSSLELED